MVTYVRDLTGRFQQRPALQAGGAGSRMRVRHHGIPQRAVRRSPLSRRHRGPEDADRTRRRTSTSTLTFRSTARMLKASPSSSQAESRR
ncbi:MAG: hypothetical protein MZU91_12745 [Desulfosudis oleivorans]|nr:hypothetical protein [Desulfosudis oleivorans]